MKERARWTLAGFVAALLLVGLVLYGCGADPFSPGPGIIVEAFTPPPEWAAIYAQVEACAGMPEGDFAGIKWFWVLNADTQTGWVSGPGAAAHTWGMMLEPQREAYLIHGDTTQLRHEMLHDILVQHGWRPPPNATVEDTHPSPPFGVCAPVNRVG